MGRIVAAFIAGFLHSQLTKEHRQRPCAWLNLMNALGVPVALLSVIVAVVVYLCSQERDESQRALDRAVLSLERSYETFSSAHLPSGLPCSHQDHWAATVRILAYAQDTLIPRVTERDHNQHLEEEKAYWAMRFAALLTPRGEEGFPMEYFSFEHPKYVEEGTPFFIGVDQITRLYRFAIIDARPEFTMLLKDRPDHSFSEGEINLLTSEFKQFGVAEYVELMKDTQRPVDLELKWPNQEFGDCDGPYSVRGSHGRRYLELEKKQLKKMLDGTANQQ